MSYIFGLQAFLVAVFLRRFFYAGFCEASGLMLLFGLVLTSFVGLIASFFANRELCRGAFFGAMMWTFILNISVLALSLFFLLLLIEMSHSDMWSLFILFHLITFFISHLFCFMYFKIKHDGFQLGLILVYLMVVFLVGDAFAALLLDSVSGISCIPTLR